MACDNLRKFYWTLTLLATVYGIRLQYLFHSCHTDWGQYHDRDMFETLPVVEL